MNPAIRHVYVHFPYCLHRCGYCDFATTVARVIPRERYLAQILTELEIRGVDQEFAPLESVFFGGGTPSLWGPQAIAAVLNWLERRAGFTEAVEITLEANPGALESGDLAAYATAGINRVSVGIQALHDARLRALDRLHDAESARQTLAQLERLLAAGRLRSANADLIFGVPGQTLLDLRTDVAGILDYGLSHLSAYSLTVESGTPLAAQVKRGLVARPDDDLQATMLDTLPDLLAPYGLTRYEVSNYARPGHASQHNLAYWTGRYYLAVGVGAHGFLPRAGAVGLRYGNTRKHEIWLRALAQRELAEDLRESIDLDQHQDERLLTGLRLSAGLDLRAFAVDLGDRRREDLLRRAQPGIARGDFWMRDEHLGVSPPALARLDRLIAELA